MRDQEYFEEKLIEGAEMMVDVSDIYKVKLQEISKIFKFAFGQPVSNFKDILDYTFFIRGIPTPESAGKLEVIIEKFITAIRYFSYLGMDEEKINRQLSNFGITINRTDWSPEGGDKASLSKYNNAWHSMYPNDDPMPIDATLLKFLLDEGCNQKSEILALTDEVTTIGEHVEAKCEVSKSSFKKGVGLKTEVLRGKDILEKVQKIEKAADEVSQVITVLG